MSTLLRHVYCFLSQGKLENEFLWAEVERVHEGSKWGRCACMGVRGWASVCWGTVVLAVKGAGGGDAKLCSVTGRSFLLRQLNCGKRGSTVALPFALHCHSLSPRHAEHILIKDTNTHFSDTSLLTLWGQKLFLKIVVFANCNPQLFNRMLWHRYERKRTPTWI